MQKRLSALARALRALPQAEQDVIVLTYYDRMTDDQIAERMEITPEEVKALRQRAEDELSRQGII